MQARSRAMVERILEAASVVLHREGIQGFGTRPVADEAGISVGSLYQYFADKDSLLQAMGERLTRRIQEQLTTILPSLGSVGPRDFIRILIGSMVEMLDRDGGRDLTLMRHWKALNLGQDVGSVERVLMQYVELLANTQPVLRSMPDRQRTLYIGINAVFFNVMRFASEPSPYFGREELIEGLVDMLDLYVQNRFERAGKPAEKKDE